MAMNKEETERKKKKRTCCGTRGGCDHRTVTARLQRDSSAVVERQHHFAGTRGGCDSMERVNKWRLWMGVEAEFGVR